MQIPNNQAFIVFYNRYPNKKKLDGIGFDIKQQKIQNKYPKKEQFLITNKHYELTKRQNWRNCRKYLSDN